MAPFAGLQGALALNAKAGAGAGAGASVLSPHGLAIYAGLIGLDYLLRERPPPPPPTVVKASAVYRPRVILGTARVAGHLAHVFQDPANPADLHLVYLLANGPMDRIEGLWIAGHRVSISRTPTADGHRIDAHDLGPVGTDLTFTDTVTAWEYFAADGTGGSSLRSMAGSGWTAAHRAQGLSWVHVRLRAETVGTLFQQVPPPIEFLVRGRRFRVEGMAAEGWTENAALVRRFYRQQFLGETTAEVDAASLTAAVATCEAEILGDAVIDAGFTRGAGAAWTPTVEREATFSEPANRITHVEVNRTPGWLQLRSDSSTVKLGHWLRNNRIRVTLTFPGSPPTAISYDAVDIDYESSEGRIEGQFILYDTLARIPLTQAQATALTVVAQTHSTVQISLRPVGLRYAACGVVGYDETPEAIETALDFAWQGHVAEHGDLAYYQPGAHDAAVRAIPPADVQQSSELYTGPDLDDRINTVNLNVPAASDRDWLENAVSVRDAAAEGADGTRLARQLPAARFVCNTPTARQDPHPLPAPPAALPGRRLRPRPRREPAEPRTAPGGSGLRDRPASRPHRPPLAVDPGPAPDQPDPGRCLRAGRPRRPSTRTPGCRWRKTRGRSRLGKPVPTPSAPVVTEEIVDGGGRLEDERGAGAVAGCRGVSDSGPGEAEELTWRSRPSRFRRRDSSAAPPLSSGSLLQARARRLTLPLSLRGLTGF